MKTINSISIKSGLFLLFVAVGLLYSCSNNEPYDSPKNTLETMGLKGKVRNLTEIIYEFQHNKIKNIKLFDENGNMIENSHHENGKLSYTETYMYDEKGHEIEYYYVDRINGLLSKGISNYDEKGNKIEEAYFNRAGILISKYINKFDEKGNKIEEADYVAEGSLRDKFFIKYDEKGREIERKSAHSDKFRSISKYDKRGNKIKETNFGNPQRYEYNKYDEFGNWLIKKHSYREKQFKEERIGPMIKRTPGKGKGIEHTIITERQIIYY